jgi:hypothetical protein
MKEYRRRLDELRSFLTAMGTLFELVVKYGGGGVERLTRLLSPLGASKPRGRSAKPAASSEGRND